MRIISGQFRGRRLAPPKNITARPTTDFAKESLFNLLNNRIDFEDCEMLDLFAGTGGIGLEFVSRGAKEVTAVEVAYTAELHYLGLQTIGDTKPNRHTRRCIQVSQRLPPAIRFYLCRSAICFGSIAHPARFNL